jgi:hypothetical protein
VTEPKRHVDLKSLARAYTESAVRRIEGLAEKAQSEGVRLEANKILLDRGWGKPASTTEVTGKDGQTIEIIVRHIEEGAKAPKR